MKINKYLEKYNDFLNEFGYIPSIRDYDMIVGYPVKKTIYRHFGSWNNYIEMAKGIYDSQGKEKKR